MSVCRCRRLCGRVAFLLLLLGVSAGAVGSGAQVPAATPDTAAARALVDSLVRVGAWRPPKPDTVRLPADTVRVPAIDGETALRFTSFFVGIAVLVGLGAATFFFGRRFFRALERRSSIGVRSHWGGFGGGDGGWEVSPALSLLTLTLVLAIMAAVVASSLIGAARPRSDDGGSAADAPTASAETGKK